MQTYQEQELKPMFHDFLGMKTTDSLLGLAPKIGSGNVRLSEGSPSGSVSVGATSGGGRGSISSTSDLGSERQIGGHLEGVPFYGPRSDISGPETSNRLAGSKRSNSDLTLMGSSRDGSPHIGSDSRENSHLMKILRNGTGVERARRSNDEEVFFGLQPQRPSSASLVLQPPTGNRTDANLSKWDRSVPLNMYSPVQYPLRGGQFASFMNQLPHSRFKDANASTSIIYQSAADEGSRTGIKGHGLLSASNVVSDRNSSGLLPTGSRGKPGLLISAPESSTSPSQHGFTSSSRQMTIFYGGQAHVFDDVHPNKADVIMSLAGSNGGSWSTSYASKSAGRQVGESHMPGGANETCTTSDMAFLREAHGRFCVTGDSSHRVDPVDRISTPTGGNEGNIITKETRNRVEDNIEL